MTTTQSRALRVIVHSGPTTADGGQGQGTASCKGGGWSPGRDKQETLTEDVLKTNSFKSNSISGSFLHFPHQGRLWGAPLPTQSLAVLPSVKKVKEPPGPAPALPSRAESLFIWVCKQFPPAPDCFISCPCDTRPVSQPISSRPFLQQSLTHPAPSPLPQLAVTSSKGIPEEMSFAPITGQSEGN